MKIFNKSEWQKVKLGDICEVVTGNTPLKKIKEYWDKDEVPFITPPELKYEGINYITPSIFVSKIGAKQGKIIPKNSICVCCIGSLGKLGILKEDAITNQQINSLLLKNENVDLLYLYFYLKTIKNNLEGIASSTTVKIINKSSFEKIEINLPNLEIQRKISQKLESLENNIKLRKSQLTFLNELNKSLFTSIFGDIKNNDKNWEIKKIEDCVLNNVKNINLKTNGRISYIDISSIDNKKNKILSYKEYDNINEAPSRAKKILNENDILISTVRPILKNIAIFNKKKSELTIASTGFCILRSKNTINSKYIFEIIKSDNFTETLIKKQIGANYPAVSDRDIKSIKIPVPPIELQNKFAERIEKIEKLKFEIEKSIEEAQKLYDSLISKYFDN